MRRALVVKELRESLAPAALAAIGIAAALASLWGVPLTPWHDWSPTSLPFVHDNIYTWLPWICGGLAALLAMKQTAWEEMKGTFRYLFYRPVDRRRVLYIKMAVGLTLVAGASALFILIHGLWASANGRHASPFFWSMTLPAWQIWFVLPPVYLAAFLSGMRPGLWYGSRLLPLFGAGLVAFALALQPWWQLTLAGSTILSLIALRSILYVSQTRDY